MQEIEKLISLMNFIKEMHKLNTPLQRRITMPFVDINLLKELENNELVIVKLDGSLNEDGAFLHIRKPTFTACPFPDDKIQPWLIKGWEDYRSEVYVKEKLTTIGDDGFEIELLLSEIEEVSELIDKWVNIRSEWSIRENEKYRIQTLYVRLFDLSQWVERSPDEYEIALADCFLKYQDVNFPVVSRQVNIVFNAETSAIYVHIIFESDCELHSRLLNEISQEPQQVLVDKLPLLTNIDENRCFANLLLERLFPTARREQEALHVKTESEEYFYVETHNDEELKRKIDELYAQRKEIINSLSEDRQKLFDARKADNLSIVISGESYSPVDAAQFILKNSDTLGWIPSGVVRGAPLSLTEIELNELYDTNITITANDELEMERSFYPTCEYPEPSIYKELLEIRTQIKQMECNYRADLWHETNNHKLTSQSLKSLRQDALEAARLIGDEETWQSKCALAGHWGQKNESFLQPWMELISKTKDTYQYLLNVQPIITVSMPYLPQEYMNEEVLNMVEINYTVN